MICWMRRLCTIQKGEAQCCSSHQSLLFLPYPITATSSSLYMMYEKLNERSRQILDEIKRRTSTTAYQLEFDTESAPTIFDSKVGGLPYWDPEKTYPTDSNGKKMYLLAQINFDQDKAESPLPQSGMLQFFVGDDDLYGLDYDPTKQKDWRIVYHEKIDTSVTTEEVEAMGIHVSPDNEEVYSPVFRSCVFHLVKQDTWIGPHNWESFGTLAKEIASDMFGESDFEYAPDVFGEEQFKIIQDELWGTACSQLLGYPFFTQVDVREEGSHYDTLLFQLDSETVDEEEITMWGDCGVGNFFINAEDLKRLDFSNVLYNWDCC